jgi:hypothetical protein
MIPRYQRIAYWALIAGILVLLGVLVHGRVRKQQRILAMRDQSPIPAPTDVPNEQVSVAIANDADGSVTLDTISLPLPEEPALRARILLDRVLTDAARPASTHPLPIGPGVADVFLLALPLSNPAANSMGVPARNFPELVRPYGSHNRDRGAGSKLAVVNLTKPFADAHPSGIESEDLTLRILVATLHANFSDIDQVWFLVDGQPRETLNGHADITRPYAVQDPTHSIHVTGPDGSVI